jgi:replicative DNA helicase
VGGRPRGPATGLRSLDKVLGEVLQPGLHVVHGGPGVGKTAFALQVAATCGFPALYVTAEMSPLELLRRHTARVTGVFLDRLKSGEFSPDAAVALATKAIAAAPQLFLVDATTAYVRSTDLLQCAQLAQGTADHLLVAVDSIHSWAQESGAALSEYDNLNAHLGALRRVAAQLRCPILGIVERNRANMANGGLSAGAGTRRIEYGSETVVGLAVDEGPNAPVLPGGQTPITIAVEKNRHGAAGARLKAIFSGPLQQFTD